ncbi:MAG: bifunctional helix-turn-helix transcriptional regulator/GNAT family N-acetyltransferase [bacterium]
MSINSRKEFVNNIGLLMLGSRLKAISDLMMDDGKKIYEYANIDFEPKWFPLFYLISKQPGIAIVQASEIIGVSHAAISQFTTQMVKKGIIETKKFSQDERVKKLYLTQDGELLLNKLQPTWTIINKTVEEISNDSGIDIWEALNKFENTVRTKPFFETFVKNSNFENAQIIHFEKNNEEHKQAFLNLNLEWLEKYLWVAEFDRKMLSKPENILNNDGSILFVKVQDKIVGTGAISKAKDGKYELNKISVTESHKGNGIGKKLVSSLIELAKEKEIKKLYLTTTKGKLVAAISLYKKLGFIESTEDRHSNLEQPNITMELTL